MSEEKQKSRYRAIAAVTLLGSMASFSWAAFLYGQIFGCVVMGGCLFVLAMCYASES